MKMKNRSSRLDKLILLLQELDPVMIDRIQAEILAEFIGDLSSSYSSQSVNIIDTIISAAENVIAVEEGLDRLTED